MSTDIFLIKEITLLETIFSELLNFRKISRRTFKWVLHFVSQDEAALIPAARAWP